MASYIKKGSSHLRVTESAGIEDSTHWRRSYLVYVEPRTTLDTHYRSLNLIKTPATNMILEDIVNVTFKHNISRHGWYVS